MLEILDAEQIHDVLDEIPECVDSFLLDAKVPIKSGFHYLGAAITMASKDPSYINMITKTLYPDIAKKFDVTSSVVEKNIRYVLESCWKRGGISWTDHKPSNGEFIRYAVMKLRRQVVPKQSEEFQLDEEISE